MGAGIDLSRREFVAGVAMAGASSVVRSSDFASTVAASEPVAETVLTAEERAKASAELLAYFGKTATKLLRPSEGILTHPSIAPSLPGKQYSTSLWDWILTAE